MPAFLTFAFYNPNNPELWVAAGLIAFLAILYFTGAFRMAVGMLDSKSAKIQADLDEAARLRAEAEALLADVHRQREEAEVQAQQMLAEAGAEARMLEAEAKVRLEEQVVRRTELANRRIQQAEAQAAAEVKAAAGELAASLAEAVLAARLSVAKSDPLIDQAIGQLAERLQ